MKANRSRLTALEARAQRFEAKSWAYALEPAYLAMSEEEQAAIDEILQRMEKAFTGSITGALSVLSDAELNTLEAFCVACGWPEEEPVT